jgi:integrase
MARKRRGRNEGGLYLRKDGYWVASISAIGGDGRRHRTTVYGKTKREALDKLDEAKRAASGRAGDAKRLTVGAWLDQWLEMSRGGLAPTSSERNEQLVRLRLKPLIGGVKLAQVGVFHCQKLLTDMERQEITARGRQMAFQVLSRALKIAVRNKLIASNPAVDVEGRPSPPKREMSVYTEEESARLLAAAQGHRLAPLLVVAMDSGCRQGELFGLTWQDIDFAAGAMTIRRSLEQIKGRLRLKETKTKKGRRIILSPYSMQVLADHRKAMLVEGHCRPDAPVFCDTIGGRLRKSNFLRQVYRVWQKAAGVPRRRWHDLRHGLATALLERGVPAKIVSERLGHASIGMTLDVYSHVTPTMQRGVAETMDKFFREKTGT